MQAIKNRFRSGVPAGVFLLLPGLAACSKDPVSTDPPPLQDMPTVREYRYSGTLYRYYRRYASGSQQVLIDSSIIPAQATLRQEADSITVTVDSITQEPRYRFAATGPGHYVLQPCCRPYRNITITGGYDSLKVYWQAADPGSGPYLKLDEFSGKKRP